jgi:hypothetical protein
MGAAGWSLRQNALLKVFISISALEEKNTMTKKKKKSKKVLDIGAQGILECLLLLGICPSDVSY